MVRRGGSEQSASSSRSRSAALRVSGGMRGWVSLYGEQSVSVAASVSADAAAVEERDPLPRSGRQRAVAQRRLERRDSPEVCRRLAACFGEAEVAGSSSFGAGGIDSFARCASKSWSARIFRASLRSATMRRPVALLIAGDHDALSESPAHGRTDRRRARVCESLVKCFSPTSARVWISWSRGFLTFEVRLGGCLRRCVVELAERACDPRRDGEVASAQEVDKGADGARVP